MKLAVTKKQLKALAVEQKLEDALTDPGCFFVKSFVHWEKPDKPRKFKFPIVVVKTMHITSDKELKKHQWSSSGRKDKVHEILEEVYSDCLHPGMRHINIRFLSDEIVKIAQSEEYKKAYKAYLDILKKDGC